MKIKLSLILVLLVSITIIGEATSLFELSRTSTPSLQAVLVDGSSIPGFPDERFQITGLVNYLQSQNENMNVIYYKILVPDDIGNEWNLSLSFMERKPTVIIKPVNSSSTTSLQTIYWGTEYVYSCCNITKGDLLYTANATNPDGSLNITLAGTLTNNYGQNWKSRVYNSSSSSWGNVNVGISTNPDVYNRRAKLHSDGTMVGYAMESINVTIPTLIKIYKN